MTSKRIFLGIVLILMAIGFYYYAYKDHRDIATEGAVYTDTAIALKDSIVKNNEAFLNQTVAVSGVVTFIDDNSITLNEQPQTVELIGELSMHGVAKAINVSATVTQTDELITLASSFSVKASDFGIEIPSLVRKQIDENIQIEVSLPLQPK